MQLNNFSVRIPEGTEVPGPYVELPHNQEYTILIHNYREVDCIAQVHVDGKDVGRFHIKAKSNLRLERPENCNRRFLFLAVDTDQANDADADGVEVDSRGLVQVGFFPTKKNTSKSDIEKMIDELKKHEQEHHHHHHYGWPWYHMPWPWGQPYWIYRTDVGIAGTWRGNTTYGNASINNGTLCETTKGFHYEHAGRGMSTYCCGTNNYNDAGTGNIGKWDSEPTEGIQDNTGQRAPGITGLGGVSHQELPVANIEGEELLYETTISLRLVAVPEQRKTVAPLKPIVRGNPIPPPVGT